MSVSMDLHRLLGPGELTTYGVHQQTGIPHVNVRARMAALHRKGLLEYLRDEPCDPALGSYAVGVYRRVDP